MITTKSNSPPTRLIFMDNIKWNMIILVVLVHTSVTYSGIGGWYYVENKTIDTLSTVIFGMFNTYSQAFFMGILFLIAGYFSPRAYDKKGPSKFIIDKLFRLGLPTLIYIFIINPIIKYFIMGIFIKKSVQAFSDYYINYFKPFEFLGKTGPLWFALALLIFSLFYAVIRMIFRKNIMIKREEKVISHFSVISLILLITFFSFIVRIFQPFGTNIYNMQLCFFSQYIVLYIVGILAYRNNLFSRLSYSFSIMWLKIGLGIGLILWLFIMLFGGPLNGKEYMVLGGLYWQSAVYAFWEQLTCAGMCLGLIVIFRDKFNYESKLSKFLSENAFCVYVFHAPILIFISLLLRHVYFHPILKFALVSIIVIPLCYIISHLIRKVSVFNRIFK